MPVHRVTRMLLVVGGGGNPLGFLVGFSALFQTVTDRFVLFWHFIFLFLLFTSPD
jgi:hypothetical protein